jgi:hypothetical protein
MTTVPAEGQGWARNSGTPPLEKIPVKYLRADRRAVDYFANESTEERESEEPP